MSAGHKGEVLLLSKMRNPPHQHGGMEKIPPNVDRGRPTTRQTRDPPKRWSRGEEENHPPNVNELKSRFQSRDASLENFKTAEIQPTSRGRFGAVKGSPDIKRKRSTENANIGQGSNHNANSQRQSGSSSSQANKVSPQDADPEDFFESTNHVQRFQYTRAIFAKMEQQNQVEKARQKNIPPKRTHSPVRHTTVSPPPNIRSPVGNESRKGIAAAEPTRNVANVPRGRPAPAHWKQQRSAAEARSQSEGWGRTQRIGSVDNLENDQVRVKQNNIGDSEALSRSESDLTLRNRAEHDLVQKSVPNPKWLIEKYEKETKKKKVPTATLR